MKAGEVLKTEATPEETSRASRKNIGRTPYQIDRELAPLFGYRTNIERVMNQPKNGKHIPLPVVLQGQGIVNNAKARETTLLAERRAAVGEV
jgi:hypothetical protein